MKIFRCEYYWQGAWGCHQEYQCVAVATSQSEALGLALMAYPETTASFWTVSEIDTTHSNLVAISQCGT